MISLDNPKDYVYILELYIIDTFCRVNSEEKYSEHNQTEAEILQGNVLGPVLHLLFIYDISEIDKIVTLRSTLHY